MLLEEEGLVGKGLVYKDKASEAEHFLQCMDALGLFPPLSFVTTTAGQSWLGCVNMDSHWRSWQLPFFLGVCSGTTTAFLSVASRRNGSTVDKLNG